MIINEAQQKAVQCTEGQLIMIACPGSGKTTTLLHRIAYMTETLKIPEQKILMLTFTKAAAGQMKSRYETQFRQGSKVTFCTIHSFCLALLCKFADFKERYGIISESESSAFFMKLLAKNTNLGNKMDFINDLKLDISIYKTREETEEPFSPKCCREKAFFERLFKAYEDHKRKMFLIDYDDMMLMAYDVMKHDMNALSFVRQTFQYILVDEYQDINDLQKKLLCMMAGPKGNLAVVGDEDQAIYGFRGAKPGVMMQFTKDYPEAKIINLSVNYRSGKKIIEHAATLIAHNKARYDKAFLAHRPIDGIVEEKFFGTREKEISYLAEQVQKRLTEADDMAIIYRTNKQASMIAKEFLKREIPFVTNEKVGSIYDHWIYQDILSFYKMAEKRGSTWDFLKTLNHPNRYLYHEELTKAGPDQEYMLLMAERLESEEWKIAATQKNIKDYFYLLEKLGEIKTPAEFMKKMETLGQYKNYLEEFSKYRGEEVSELQSVWEELYLAAANCETFADWDRQAMQEKKELTEAFRAKGGVTLTTMHGAKGLEWKIVYIVDCVAGKNPYKKAKTADELEEERRLFYVAMTRAKEELYLLRHLGNGAEKLSMSPYLWEAGVTDRPEEKNRSVSKKATVSRENSYEKEKKQREIADRKTGEILKKQGKIKLTKKKQEES